MDAKTKRNLDALTNKIARLIKTGKLTTAELDTITEAQQCLLEVVGD